MCIEPTLEVFVVLNLSQQNGIGNGIIEKNIDKVSTQ